MVRTHLRTRAAQSGALLAVIVGGIAVAPAVALADPPNVQITNLNTEVVSGGQVTLQYSVTGENGEGQGDGQRAAQIQVNTGGMRCSGDCGQISPIGRDGRQFTARLTAPNVDAGQSRQVQIQITATTNNPTETGDASSTITVKGPDAPQNVRQISGRVKDQDGKNLSGAAVAMQDSANNKYSTTTNGSGQYSFTSSDSKPIAPGNISVGALKGGYEQATVQIQASAGRTVNTNVTLKEIAASPSPSPSASVSASATAEPTEESSAEPELPPATVASDPDTDKAASEQDDGGSMLFIILGGLLVAAGIGAIVLVWLRRKNGGDDGNDDDPTALPGGGGGVPPSQGRFNDATRVGTPVGASRDATMIAPLSGAPSMSDAPTMLQRPVVDDEFPDPYGVPIPQQGGYAGNGAAAGGWDNANDGYGTAAAAPQYGAAAGGYNDQGQYGQADDGYDAAGYGGAAAATGAYGGPAEQPRRYDEPTGMYRPEAEPEAAGYGATSYEQDGYGQPAGGAQYAGYGEPAGGYPPAAGGYPSADGYAHQPAADQGGYGGWGGAPDNGQNAYGPQSGAAQPYGGTGNYGAAAPQQYSGGYDDGQNAYGAAPQQAGGYDQQHGGAYGGQPYGQPGADYEDPQPEERPGYDQYGQQGYDQRGGYGGQPRR